MIIDRLQDKNSTVSLGTSPSSTSSFSISVFYQENTKSSLCACKEFHLSESQLELSAWQHLMGFKTQKVHSDVPWGSTQPCWTSTHSGLPVFTWTASASEVNTYEQIPEPLCEADGQQTDLH